jgi:transcriptional regulator with XRE-family HTH domain
MSDRGTRAPAQDWYDLVIQTIALKNMTKAQLASRSGVSRATIDRWGKGASRPAQAASVNAVADALGIRRERALRLAGVIAADPAQVERSPPRDVIDEAFGDKAGDFREAVRRIHGPDADRKLRLVEEALSRPPAADDAAPGTPAARPAPR